MRLSFRWAAISLLMLFVEGPLAAAALLSPPPGNYTVSRVATNAEFATINNSGQVAGTTPAVTGYSLFLWTPLAVNGTVGTLTDLGGLPLLANLDAGVWINDRGQVVSTAAFQNLARQIVLWSPDTPNGASGSYSQIPIATSPLACGGISCNPDFAVGINNFGQVAGAWQIWTPSSANGTSGTNFTDSRFDLIKAINAFGQTISGFPQAYLFTPAVANGNSGTFTPIGLPGAASTSLVSINNNGTIVGVSCVGASNVNCQGQAFLWTPNSANGTTGTTVAIPGPAFSAR
ncbi:exported hypothetical protein [Candidatus Sulfopaludibacter sp. SbA4]|nr:exported hypothetical protein [Candidatus Sulfopaludibacter sp. SbA4]